MKCIRSTLRFALPLALLLGTAVVTTTMVPTPANAEEDADKDWTYVNTINCKDGTVQVTYQKDDKLLVELWKKDGTLTTITYKNGQKRSGEESGTDDAVGTGSRTEPIDVAGLIAKGLITIVNIKANPENTPLAKFIDADGGGLIPHYDPSYDDNKGRPGLPKVNDTDGGLTAKQKSEIIRLVNATAKSLEGVSTSMGDGVDALGGESAPGLPTNKNGRGKGTGSGNGADNNNGKKKYLGSDLSLGPRPDLVNPPHSKGTSKTATILSALNARLLEGGSTFSSNGVSGVRPRLVTAAGTAGAAAIR